MSVDYLSPVTPEILQAFTDELIAKHQDIEISTLGASILGRNIPLYQLGHGKSASLFVGAHHGAEAITSLLLMKFTEDILDARRRGLSRLAGFSVGGLLERRSIYIVPMLNPDGVAIAHLGAQAAGVLKDRVKSINGSEDFSLWQANARGVDLNHNYDAEFAKCKEAERALGIFASAPTRYAGNGSACRSHSNAFQAVAACRRPAYARGGNLLGFRGQSTQGGKYARRMFFPRQRLSRCQTAQRSLLRRI